MPPRLQAGHTRQHTLDHSGRRLTGLDPLAGSLDVMTENDAIRQSNGNLLTRRNEDEVELTTRPGLSLTLINSMSSLLASGVVRRRATSAQRCSSLRLLPLLLQRLMRWAVFSSCLLLLLQHLVDLIAGCRRVVLVRISTFAARKYSLEYLDIFFGFYLVSVHAPPAPKAD